MKIILILVFLLSTLFSYIKKAPSWFYYLFAFLLAIIAGCREASLFMDAENYIALFDGDVNDKYEPSIIFIIYLVTLVSSDPFLMFFIYAMLGVMIKAVGIKQLTEFTFLSLMIYAASFYILHDMIQIRGGVASAFFLLGIKYMYEKSHIKFVLCTFCAILFHYSAIIIIPLYFFINHKSINKLIWASLIPLSYVLSIGGVTVSFVISLIPIGFIQGLWELYQLRMDAGIGLEINIFNFGQLLRCAIALFLLYYADTIISYNKYFILLLKIYILGIISFVLLADIPDFAFRVSQFYVIVEIILIPFIAYVFKQKKIAYIFPILIGLLLLYLNVFYAQLVP